MAIIYKTIKYSILGYTAVYVYATGNFWIGLYSLWGMLLFTLGFGIAKDIAKLLVILGALIIGIDLVSLLVFGGSIAIPLSAFIVIWFEMAEQIISGSNSLAYIYNDLDFRMTTLGDWFHNPSIFGLINAVIFYGSFFKEKDVIEKQEAEEIRKANELKNEKERKRKERNAKKRKAEKAAKIEKLCKEHGEKFGEAVFNKDVIKGMKEKSVIASLGKANLKQDNILFYSSDTSPLMTGVSLSSGVVSSIDESEAGALKKGMSQNDIKALWGKPADIKKTVLKKGTKTKWFFFSRLTRQNTIVYGYRTDFEDGLLVGWRELD
tara:strand:- start:1490 stop:2452 length:963 start_codon:yes stop_codon:yes gene_type:complete